MEQNARFDRDQRNAQIVQREALPKSERGPSFAPTGSFAAPPSSEELALAAGIRADYESHAIMAREPFHAMLEVDVENDNGKQAVLWYVNTSTKVNSAFRSDDGKHFGLLAWTHPGAQIALSRPLNQQVRLPAGGFKLRSVKATARARFSSVLPEIRGVYEVDGEKRAQLSPIAPSVAPERLKSVKLGMTAEQVDAFIAQMDGFLLISGAPGTGKTTVALQRIRFLLDQQEESKRKSQVKHSIASTRVFLASGQLQEYVADLLDTELRLPHDVVAITPAFIEAYVDDKWLRKNKAIPRRREIDATERLGREACFNLCSASDLKDVWETYERQIKQRLRTSPKARWLTIITEKAFTLPTAGLEELHKQFAADIRVVDDPRDSGLRMDPLFGRVRRAYHVCRDSLKRDNDQPDEDQERFDSAFASWLYWVYDPLEALVRWFGENREDALHRIAKGIGDSEQARDIAANIEKDWTPSDSLKRGRMYGPEEVSWVAWLLRFALPESMGSRERFPGIGVAQPRRDNDVYGFFNHVVIDEAQDLAVQEAALLASCANPRGALTVSADFQQLVSPAHGMTDEEALRFGSSMRKHDEFTTHSFGTNMRQSKAIGEFLAEFYETAFQRKAPFSPGAGDGPKPELHIAYADRLAADVSYAVELLRADAAIRTIAVVQIDDDATRLAALAGLTLHDAGKAEVRLLSAQHVKGLEFDACVVLGLDDVERTPINHSKNRAYVAMSRATQRLLIVCAEFPTLLQRVSPHTYTLIGSADSNAGRRVARDEDLAAVEARCQKAVMRNLQEVGRRIGRRTRMVDLIVNGGVRHAVRSLSDKGTSGWNDLYASGLMHLSVEATIVESAEFRRLFEAAELARMESDLRSADYEPKIPR